MAKWLQPFSFGSKSYKQSECERPSPTATPIKHKIPYLEPENIRECSIFAAEVCLGPKGCFCLFPLCSEEADEKKTLNLRFFAKKQVIF